MHEIKQRKNISSNEQNENPLIKLFWKIQSFLFVARL